MFNKLWFKISLIVFLTLSSYSFILNAPFKYWDDEKSIINNSFIKDTHHLKEIFTQGYFNDHTFYRPLVNISYMLEYQAFGLNSFFYNLDNVLLHILNSFLVWGLVSLITENSLWGFWVGLLFAIHPIQTEAVGNISGRAILLSGSFVLSSFIAFLLYEKRLKANFLFLSVSLFVLALLCKESSGILPGVIFLYLWFKKKKITPLWPFAVVVVLYLGLRHYLGLTERFPWQNADQYILGFVTFLNSLITDVRALLVPLNLYFDRSQKMFLSFGDGIFLLTILFWAFFIGILWFYRSKIKTIEWFCLLWFFVEMVPVSQLATTIGVAPGVISCANHFLYLASIPVFIIIVEFVRNFKRSNEDKQWVNNTIISVLIGSFFVFFLLLDVEQNIYASNELAMLKRSLQIQPYNARVQSAVGIIYAKNSKYTEAQPYFIRAVEEDPVNPRYMISLSQTVCDQGYYEKCLKMYNSIKDPGPLAQLLNDNKQAALKHLNEQHVQILSK